jgi:hypothetical protein
MSTYPRERESRFAANASPAPPNTSKSSWTDSTATANSVNPKSNVVRTPNTIPAKNHSFDPLLGKLG